MPRNRKKPVYNPRETLEALAPRVTPASHERPKRGDPRILDQIYPFAALARNVEDPDFDELAQGMLVKLRGVLRMSLPLIRSRYLWQIHHNTNLGAARAQFDRKLFTAVVELVEGLIIENSAANSHPTTSSMDY